MAVPRIVIRYGIFGAIGLAIATAGGAPMAQDAKPTSTHGVSVGTQSSLALGPQMPDMAGYALRLRTIVLQPGAVVGHHSHAKRPVVAYLISGEYTEHRDDQGEIVHHPGDQWVEGKEVAHWSENRGAEPAVLINVDILPAR